MCHDTAEGCLMVALQTWAIEPSIFILLEVYNTTPWPQAISRATVPSARLSRAPRCTSRCSSGAWSRAGIRRWWGCHSPCRWARPPAGGSPHRIQRRACCTGWGSAPHCGSGGAQGKRKNSIKHPQNCTFFCIPRYPRTHSPSVSARV